MKSYIIKLIYIDPYYYVEYSTGANRSYHKDKTPSTIEDFLAEMEIHGGEPPERVLFRRNWEWK